jgi:hypothetical protein
LYLAEFRNCKRRAEECSHDLQEQGSGPGDITSEVDAGGRELKRAMKEATDSEYAISQKLAYEKGARRGLEVEFEVVLKSLRSDQITIAGYEVELHDQKGAANYAIDCIAVPSEGDEARSIVDRLIDTPNRLLTLLRATSLAAATDALVRVKSHYPDVQHGQDQGRC